MDATDTDTPEGPRNSQMSGDTQPFRPAAQYRPLTSEPPLEEPDYQQTAPFKPIQQAAVTPARGGATSRTLGVAALLLVAAAVAAYFTIRGGAGLGGAVAVERALPSNTLLYFSISPAPSESQRKAFERMREAFEAQPGSSEAIASLVMQVRTAISSLGLSFGAATDPDTFDTLAGYLGGNVTIAVLAPSQGDLLSLKPSASSDINPLAAYDVLTRRVVGLVDLDFSPDSGPKQGIIAELRAVKDNLDKARVVETYNGTDIREYTAGPAHLYFSLLGGTSTAAVGLSSTPVKVVIDELKTGKGLKEDDRFKYLVGKVPAERVGTLYINASSVDKAIKQLFPEANGQLQMDGALLVSLSGQDEGIQVDVAADANLSGPSTLTLYGWTARLSDLHMNPNAIPRNSALDDIPANSLAFVAGSDLKATITYMLDGMDNLSGGSTWREAMKRTIGLDLDSDLLAWMGGDYTVSVATSETKPDVAPLIAQIKLSGDDRAKAADALKRGIDTTFSGAIKPLDLAGGTFYPISYGSTAGAIIGTTNNQAILVYDNNLSAAKANAQSLSSNLGKGFGTTDKWKTISGHLPTNSNLIAYLNATALRETTERAITPGEKADYDKRFAPFLRPIKYVLAGSASEPTKEGEMSRNLTRIFIGISK